MGLFNLFKSKPKIEYSLDTLESIRSIPSKQNILKSFDDGRFNESILYKLQKKATEYDKNKNTDLAIACLEKAFNIMQESDYYYGDYADRYVRYLRKYRYFDKAREIESIIESRTIYNSASEITIAIENAKRLGTDLLEADFPKPTDAKTAIYRGRIYSISGNDKRFPKLPDDIEDTEVSLHPFVFGTSEPTFCKIGQEIEKSNRAFKDTRSSNERKEYERIIKVFADDEKNRKDYDWVWENLPDLSPKSLSGYTRMKNSNSSNFQKLKKAALEKGYEI